MGTGAGLILSLTHPLVERLLAPTRTQVVRIVVQKQPASPAHLLGQVAAVTVPPQAQADVVQLQPVLREAQPVHAQLVPLKAGQPQVPNPLKVLPVSDTTSGRFMTEPNG